MAGLAARTALELGIDSVKVPRHAGQFAHTLQQLSILFCTVYDLDHRNGKMIGLLCVLTAPLKQEHLAAMVLWLFPVRLLRCNVG